MEEERAKRRQAPAETESPDSALGATNRTFAANRAVTVAFVRHAWRVTAKGARSSSPGGGAHAKTIVRITPAQMQ